MINALRERLEREERKEQTVESLAEDVMEIGRHCASLPLLDERQPNETLGYDKNGVLDDYRHIRARGHHLGPGVEGRSGLPALSPLHPNGCSQAAKLLEVGIVMQVRRGEERAISTSF